MVGPWRRRAARSRLAKARSGERNGALSENAGGSAAHPRPPEQPHTVSVSRANARVQLRAVDSAGAQ